MYTKQFELRCSGCPESPQSDVFACSRCYYDQMNPAMDPVYQNSVKPLMWLCACVLPTVSEIKTCLPGMSRLLNSLVYQPPCIGILYCSHLQFTHTR